MAEVVEVEVEVVRVVEAAVGEAAAQLEPEPARSRRRPQAQSGMLSRICPGEMGTILAVDVEPHAAAEKAHLERVVRGHEVRHRAGRHAQVAVRPGRRRGSRR